MAKCSVEDGSMGLRVTGGFILKTMGEVEETGGVRPRLVERFYLGQSIKYLQTTVYLRKRTFWLSI